jgi:hypothetical protein
MINASYTAISKRYKKKASGTTLVDDSALRNRPKNTRKIEAVIQARKPRTGFGRFPTNPLRRISPEHHRVRAGFLSSSTVSQRNTTGNEKSLTIFSKKNTGNPWNTYTVSRIGKLQDYSADFRPFPLLSRWKLT